MFMVYLFYQGLTMMVMYLFNLYQQPNFTKYLKANSMEKKDKIKTENWNPEKELRQLFRNNSDCYAQSDDVVLAITEDKFIELLTNLNSDEKWKLVNN